ncbi:hypothetical protein GM418_11945 [Maribellus comscasis]|uniref:Uncharacterized protein n=1 Tax=Maribellus comscasis TaxID=2681766 RepID=A0A6I6JW24_9BACT|nr:hypothetical protein [Maribellus comscasis]QGY44342.1 hypothetical protein GM418_11945 [Maribellus comscasis]
MKTKSNVQKAILRSGAVIISFVLISFTVSAQEFWRKLLTHSSFNEIAIAMIETTDNKADVPVKAGERSNFQFYAVQEFDNDLNLESWMTTDFYFNLVFFKNEAEVESALELEDWMINENLFSPEKVNDEPMELEAWMISHEVWNS